MNSLLRLSCILMVSQLPSVAAADETASGKADSTGSLEVPTSPAFEALGATPSSVLRPSSIRELGVDLETSVGSGGVNPGFALEAAPLWLWLGRDVTLEQWRKHLGNRVISRIALSLASEKLDGDRLVVAEGVRFAILDDSDPRWDRELEGCLKRVAASTLPSEPPASAGSALSEASTPATIVEAPAAAAECRQQNVERARRRGDRQLAVAGAAVQYTDPQGTKVTNRSVDVWLSGSYAFSGSEVLIATLRGKRDFDTDTDSATFALRGQVGNSQTSFALDASGTVQRQADGDPVGQAVVAAVFEQEVAEAIWVTANGGGRLGEGVEPGQRLFIIVGLKLDSTAFPLFHRAL